MKTHIVFILSFLFCIASFAQNKIISLGGFSTNSYEIRQNFDDKDSLFLNIGLSYIEIAVDESSKKHGDYLTLQSDGLVKTFDVGKPNIPVFSKLIELPLSASVRFHVIGFDEKIIDLGANGFDQKIIPAQPSASKSEEPKVHATAMDEIRAEVKRLCEK